MKIQKITDPTQFKSEKGMNWTGYGIFNIPPEDIINERFLHYKDDGDKYLLTFTNATISISKEKFQKGFMVVIFNNNFSNGPL